MALSRADQQALDALLDETLEQTPVGPGGEEFRLHVSAEVAMKELHSRSKKGDAQARRIVDEMITVGITQFLDKEFGPDARPSKKDAMARLQARVDQQRPA